MNEKDEMNTAKYLLRVRLTLRSIRLALWYSYFCYSERDGVFKSYPL